MSALVPASKTLEVTRKPLAARLSEWFARVHACNPTEIHVHTTIASTAPAFAIATPLRVAMSAESGVVAPDSKATASAMAANNRPSKVKGNRNERATHANDADVSSTQHEPIATARVSARFCIKL